MVYFYACVDFVKVVVLKCSVVELFGCVVAQPSLPTDALYPDLKLLIMFGTCNASLSVIGVFGIVKLPLPITCIFTPFPTLINSGFLRLR